MKYPGEFRREAVELVRRRTGCAHRLAVVMREDGDDVETIEHHLVALGISDAVAADVVDNLRRL